MGNTGKRKRSKDYSKKAKKPKATSTQEEEQIEEIFAKDVPNVDMSNQSKSCFFFATNIRFEADNSFNALNALLCRCC